MKRERRQKAKAKADLARTGRTSDDSDGRTDGRTGDRERGGREETTRRHSEDGRRSGCGSEETRDQKQRQARRVRRQSRRSMGG